MLKFLVYFVVMHARESYHIENGNERLKNGHKDILALNVVFLTTTLIRIDDFFLITIEILLQIVTMSVDIPTGKIFHEKIITHNNFNCYAILRTC